MKIECVASNALINIGCVLRGDTDDFWSIIEKLEQDQIVTTDLSMTLENMRAHLSESVTVRVFQYERNGSYDLIFENRTGEGQLSVLCVSMQRKDNTLRYANETCVMTDDPADLCGRFLTEDEERAIESVIFAAIV